MVEAELAASKGEARRLIESGGVKLDKEKVIDPFAVIPTDKDSVLLQVGKRKFLHIVSSPT